MLDLAILGLLKEQPLHGYELKKRLGELLGVFWGVSYGSLYPALGRLERAGAIETVAPEPSVPIPATGSLSGDLATARRRGERHTSTSRRTRKAYRITERGNELFAELLVADDAHGDDREFALRLAFLGHAAPETRVSLLERRRAVLEDRLARACTPSQGSANRHDRYTRSLAEHRTTSMRNDLDWVGSLIAAEHEPPAAKEQQP